MIYIPAEVYEKASDLVALIKHTVALEYAIDADRLVYEDFLLVTMRHWDLEVGESQGMTGWHIDGH